KEIFFGTNVGFEFATDAIPPPGTLTVGTDTNEIQLVENAGKSRAAAQSLQADAVQVQDAKTGPVISRRFVNISPLAADVYLCPCAIHKDIFPQLALWCSILSYLHAVTRGRPMDILISAERIQDRVGELAWQIAKDFRDRRPLTIVGVLTG